MSKKVLFVSQYVAPQLVGGNNNVYRQAFTLKHTHGVDVEILTWPERDHWTGPLPDSSEPSTVPYIRWLHEGLTFHIIQLPSKLLERVPTERDWREAVEIGCKLLKEIKPAIVHLQHWRGLWWILEAAKRLLIPTVYSPHDWGVGCLRTILVKGEGGMCDGIVGISKCSRCIVHGRNLAGRANEFIVSSPVGERMLKALGRSKVIDRWLTKNDAVRIGVNNRVTLNLTRANSILSSLHALVVPNEFAKRYYLQFGIARDRVFVHPWYYDLTAPINHGRPDRQAVVLGFIGRISSEKGVRRIFEALQSDSIAFPIHLVIAGAIDSAYAVQLLSEYRHKVGRHSVEWMGWIPHHSVNTFYQKVDAVIIPSDCIENGPLTLIESFAFKRPVIITKTPTATDLVQDGITGYLVSFGSTESLTQVIAKVCGNPEGLLKLRNNLPPVSSSIEYTESVKRVYETVLSEANNPNNGSDGRY